MDAQYIDDLASRGLASPCRYLPARRLAGRACVVLLPLVASAVMAGAGGQHEPDASKSRAPTSVGVAEKQGESSLAPAQRNNARMASGQVQPAPPVAPTVASAPEVAVSDREAPTALDALTGHLRPTILPALSDEIRLTALQEGKRLRSITPMASPASAPANATSMATSARAKPLVNGAVAYALVTDITRTRVASELRQQLMGSSATVGELPGMPRTDLMQVDTGWRAVVWPFATEPEADRARRLLAERGIRTELLKF